MKEIEAFFGHQFACCLPINEFRSIIWILFLHYANGSKAISNFFYSRKILNNIIIFVEEHCWCEEEISIYGENLKRKSDIKLTFFATEFWTKVVVIYYAIEFEKNPIRNYRSYCGIGKNIKKTLSLISRSKY